MVLREMVDINISINYSSNFYTYKNQGLYSYRSWHRQPNYFLLFLNYRLGPTTSEPDPRKLQLPIIHQLILLHLNYLWWNILLPAKHMKCSRIEHRSPGYWTGTTSSFFYFLRHHELELKRRRFQISVISPC